MPAMKTKILHFIRLAVCGHIFWLGSSSATAAVFSFQGTIEQVPGLPTFPDHTLDYFEFCVDADAPVILRAVWIGGNAPNGVGISMGIFSLFPNYVLSSITDASASIRNDRIFDDASRILGMGNYAVVVRWSATDWDQFEGIAPFYVSGSAGSGTYRIELEGDITMKRILEGQGDGTFRVTNLIPEPGAPLLMSSTAILCLSRRRRGR